MPSSLHPQAKFDPIPPDLDLNALVEKTPNFDYVIRISADQIGQLGLAEFEKLVLLHVIVGGKPLVIEGWNANLPPWLFSKTWLEDNVGKKQENVRDIGNGVDIPMTIGHYLGAMEKLMKQWTPANFRDLKRQRLYLKDIDCPEAWYQHLQSVIPQALFYLNDCVGEEGGPGALHERNMYNQLVLGKGIGPAGDLMSNLPPKMRAENMMCYIGHEGTYTPAHREMCASLGQNIMVETSAAEKGEKAGSSIWFMTESKDREVVSEYFLSMLGHDIEVESHFAQINAWKKAPFPVYIVEQKFGDFILIPPLAPHQVWNRGTRTMKVAWNRTTVETLELALHEALPRARMVCRDEQYKNKAIIYFSLLRYYDQLKLVEQAEEEASWPGPVTESIKNAVRVRQLKKDFKRLFALYTEALVTEMFSPDLPKEKNVEFLPFDSNVTCSYCRCNIFNRFLTCKTCIGEADDTGGEDTYDVCMECYAMGRSCGCISNLKWVEQWQWSMLTQRYEDWRAMVIANDGFIDDSSPQTLNLARAQYGKKPVAQICQEQLKQRPWVDISEPVPKEPSPGDSDAEPDVDNEGRLRKKRATNRKSQQLKKSHRPCHICHYRESNWKLAICTTCPNAYCYGTLWRAFDLKPQTVMEQADWKCPKCLKICSCGACRRKDPTQQAYRPKGTLLGHDTRLVADPRSVESLVDFSRTNLTWLRGEGDDDPQTSIRMQKLMEKAQTEKAREETLEEEPVVDEDGGRQNGQDFQGVDDSIDNMAIDPQLCNSEPDTLQHMQGPSSSHLVNGSEVPFAPMLDESGHTESDSRHINAPNGAHAHRHSDHNNPQPGSNTYNGYAAPADMIFGQESLYPDPSGLGRDRMMGMGYYQQANDADRILFDYPDPGTPTLQDPNSTYPRLLQEPEQLQTTGKKRNAETMTMSINGEVDEVHMQVFHARRKQKLAEAKNGSYFMTLNQLDGGSSLILNLPLKKSKDFLKNLDELDMGQTRPRRSPRTNSGSIVNQQRLSGPDDETLIVGSDVQDKVVQSMYREDSDDQEDSIALATRAVQSLAATSREISKPAAEAGSPPRGQKHGRLRKVSSGLSRKPLPTKDLCQEAGKASILTEKSEKRRRSSVVLARRNAEESQEAASPDPNIGDKGQESSTSLPCKGGKEAEVISAEPPQGVSKSAFSVKFQETPAVDPISSASDSLGDEDIAYLVDENYNPMFVTPVKTTRLSTSVANDSESDGYQIAKEKALCMVEAELEEAPAKQHSEKASQVTVPVPEPKKINGSPLTIKAPKVVAKSLPKAPPGKLLSMAERQALRGKSFKIVRAKSKPTRAPASAPTTASESESSSIKPQIIVRPDRNKSYDSAEDSPSSDDDDDDDDSIPAVRPVARKPRIQSLVCLNGKAKTTVTPAVGMLDGISGRKP